MTDTFDVNRIILVDTYWDGPDVDELLRLGWKLLEVGKNSFTGENGPYSRPWYVLGWLEDDPPTLPA